MAATRILLLVVSLVGIVYGQDSSQCQQSCDNNYNFCTANANQQLSNCLAYSGGQTSQCHRDCDGRSGCPNGSPTTPEPWTGCRDGNCCTIIGNQQNTLCNSNYNDAIASCDASYSSCSNDCGGQVPPSVAVSKPLQCPRKTPSDVTWSLLVRRLSRPEKLKLPA